MCFNHFTSHLGGKHLGVIYRRYNVRSVGEGSRIDFDQLGTSSAAIHPEACRMRLFFASLLAIFCNFIAGAAAAQDSQCSAGYEGGTAVAFSAEEFFLRPLGSVAIGLGCSAEARSCNVFYEITGCTSVDYHLRSLADGELNIVYNTIMNCGDIDPCETSGGFLAVAYSILNSPHSISLFSNGVRLFRNAGWLAPVRIDRFNSAYGSKWSEQVSDPLSVSKFFELQGNSGSLEEFRASVSRLFHANRVDPASDRLLESWGERQIFTEGIGVHPECVNRAIECSFGVMLLGFNQLNKGIPSQPLRINISMHNADGVIIRTRSPIEGGLYDSKVQINFKYPVPTPRPPVPTDQSVSSSRPAP